MIDDKIRDENLQYNLKREVVKILTLLSNKIDKYESLTGEEVLPLNQSQMIEQAEFTCSNLGKAFEKQRKTIENKEAKQKKGIRAFKIF